METPMLLTQDQIDAAVAPETLALYWSLHTAGLVPEDETRGTLAPYTEVFTTLHDATARDPALHELALALDDAAGALVVETFDEGFRRGVAFTRWLASRPDPALASALVA